jgi:DNA-binding LacI/PurR family transcriptional regulator
MAYTRHTRSTVERGPGGRPTSALITLLHKEISAGKFPAGEFLPTVRELSSRHGLACSTVHRALKQLVADGVVAAEPRQGYRVLAGADGAEPERGCPVAFVFSEEDYPPEEGDFSNVLLSAFQRAAAARGWSLLSMAARPGRIGEVVEQVRSGRAGAVAVDNSEPEILDALSGTGLPVVAVNCWPRALELDCVMQDGQLGGLQAAEYLLARGHRKIAWFGRGGFVDHSMDRLSGAMVGMMQAGLSLDPRSQWDVDYGDAEQRARELLAGQDRPTAILALWQYTAAALARVAGEMGLQVGKDFDLVGWAREEDFDRTHALAFEEGKRPPAIVWSVNQMAEAALGRLQLRRERPGISTLRIKVPTRLRLGDGGDQR